MNCPVCSQLMVEKDFDFNVHICESGCKGIWFDHGELQKFDKKNARLGDALQAALNYPRTNDKKRPPLKCPKCNMVMHTHKYSSAQEVNVDECYGCGGFFLGGANANGSWGSNSGGCPGFFADFHLCQGFWHRGG